jgi:hypothetical protein
LPSFFAACRFLLHFLQRKKKKLKKKKNKSKRDREGEISFCEALKLKRRLAARNAV